MNAFWKTRNLAMELVLLAIGLALLAMGCAASTKNAPTNHESKNEPISKAHLKTALALENAGRYLDASVYFEAALVCGERELDLLPLLISAQVRAGRLEAAKRNMRRLDHIAPNFAGADELYLTLTLITQSEPATAELETP